MAVRTARARALAALMAGCALGAGLLGGAPAASARPVLWSGIFRSADTLALYSLQLSVDGGRVSIKSLQTTVDCTDAGDGRVSPTAVWVIDYPRQSTMHANRFTFVFDDQSSSLSPLVRYRISGTLNSRGHGSVRVRMAGDQISADSGEVIASCVGDVTFPVTRAGVRPS
ncbi:MAG: hypothetical protein KGP12_01085 [Actinomycetales bacterium]|nr:hypothetical protein [Actinomycetales bacterium]